MSSDTIPCTSTVLPAVQSGDVRTFYRREGAGSPILLLAREAGDGRPTPLLAALAGHFRVFAPRLAPAPLPASALAVAEWLHDLVDALGLDRPGLVAEDGLALATLAFAISDPERVGRSVILLTGDAGSPARVLGRHPLLLVAVGSAPLSGRTLDEVVRFLAGGNDGEDEHRV